MEGRGVLTMASIGLQDLRRRLYVKAKADKDWRFWGLYVHVGKPETLRAAYDLAKRNNGAPGIDGVTFEAIEAGGVDAFLAQLRDELAARTYRPLRNRRAEIPKDDGKSVRVLGIPAIRDRVVQGRSNSSWSRSLKRAFTMGRTAIDRSGKRTTRWPG
jgi:RNA-directed DNA polymerase